MTKSLIAIENLSLSLAGRTLLQDISLSIAPGEYLALVGPNGAGKTTLLQCLMRLLPGSGTIKLCGRRLTNYSQKALAHLIAYVPQSSDPGLPFTVKEFVLMGRYPYLNPFSTLGPQDRQAVDHALALTGTRQFMDRPLHSLSAGERQKVLIAAGLAQGADILLLDEPTTFLDPKHRIDIQRLLQRLNQDYGITLLLATHDINAAMTYSTRIAALKQGALVFAGNAGAFADSRVLETVYQQRFLFARHPQTGQPIAVAEV